MYEVLRVALVLLLVQWTLSYDYVSYAESRAPPAVQIDSNGEVEVRCSCYKSNVLNLTVVYYNETSGKNEVADFEVTRLQNSFGALLLTVDEMKAQITSAGGDGDLAVERMQNETYGHSFNSSLYSVTLNDPVPDRKYTCFFEWKSYSRIDTTKASFTVIGETAALPTSALTRYQIGSYVHMWEIQGTGLAPKFSVSFNDDWIKFAASNYTLSAQHSVFNGIYVVEKLEAIRPGYSDSYDTVEVTVAVGGQSETHGWNGEISGYGGAELDFLIMVILLIALACIFPLILIAAGIVACVRGKVVRSCCYDSRLRY